MQEKSAENDPEAIRSYLLSRYRRRLKKRESKPIPEDVVCSMCGEGPRERKTLINVGDQKRCYDHANDNIS